MRLPSYFRGRPGTNRVSPAGTAINAGFWQGLGVDVELRYPPFATYTYDITQEPEWRKFINRVSVKKKLAHSSQNPCLSVMSNNTELNTYLGIPTHAVWKWNWIEIEKLLFVFHFWTPFSMLNLFGARTKKAYLFSTTFGNKEPLSLSL